MTKAQDQQENGARAIDIDALRERYRIERDLRRASEGDRSYQDIAAAAGDLHTDPYTPVADRAPRQGGVDVLIVGGGFGGLLTAGRLREQGVSRICVVESGGDFGGTWYWNRYPGAACDVESYIYLPMLEETGYMPAERYSKADEIRAHARRIAEHYDLYRDACLSTLVHAIDWNAEAASWTVTTNRGDRFQARFVVLSTGPLNRPKLPAIPGLDAFQGHRFHTARWDYGYTGGSATEPMLKLADKRVGVIGTGATAIQCVPPLAASAGHLSVFQRTPSAVLERNNAPTDPDWVRSLKPGWQQARMENFTAQLAGALHEEDVVGDSWTVLARAIRQKLMSDPSAAENISAVLEQTDFERMTLVRERVDAIVKDAATANALKPWYSLFCKRPCFHDEYLAAFNKPNVTLVDTAGRGVERITRNGVVVAGAEHELDCLIFATGFETAGDYAKRSAFEVRGKGGISLSEKWAEGLVTLHGMHTRDFPNCFFISQAQAGMSVNFPHMLSEQAKHIAHIVSVSLDRGLRTLEPTAQAERAWVETVLGMAAARISFLEQCTPGYYNNEGRGSDKTWRSLPYGAGPVAFVQLLREWREQGDFTGLEVDGTPAPAAGEMV